MHRNLRNKTTVQHKHEQLKKHCKITSSFRNTKSKEKAEHSEVVYQVHVFWFIRCFFSQMFFFYYVDTQSADQFARSFAFSGRTYSRKQQKISRSMRPD